MVRQILLMAALAAAAMPALAEERAAADPSDYLLERMVRAAYTGASAFARENGNYFARDGVFAPLREAVAAELDGEGIAGVSVPEAAAESFAAASTCLSAPGRELRLVSNLYGDGLELVAVSSTRMFAYRYDPHDNTTVELVTARDCAKAR